MKVKVAIDPKFHIEAETAFESAAPKVTLVKTSNGDVIPPDEPLILFRARDRLALETLWYYRRLCEADGCTEFQLAGINDRIAAFEQFAKEHPERMKQPGITRGL